jgi:TRAP-type mannitol/chloroaromatic compound transport system permease large subunit
MNINMIWFSILLAVVLQTCWLSPPVALSAYYIKGIMPEWELIDIYKGMMPFMGLQMLGVAVVYLFPPLSLWLPELLF